MSRCAAGGIISSIVFTRHVWSFFIVESGTEKSVCVWRRIAYRQMMRALLAGCSCAVLTKATCSWSCGICCHTFRQYTAA
ncbi:hypothetical protein F4809DRAFT_598801 [Biscogniauxia mediterranea]|nr:hypothetical protein F4809DRAFT_598801 [Biscogniauxia mediterranea]